MNKLLIPVLCCTLLACKKDKQTTPEDPDPAPVEQEKPTKITVWDATLWSESHPKGLPVEGATVELYSTQQDYLDKKPAGTAKTDKDGIASFAKQKEGDYYIVAYKEQKTNTWADSQGRTKVSDTLFQSDEAIRDLQNPIQKNATPGDFMYKDLNGDMMINNDDVASAPFFKVTINNTTPVAGSVVIGYPVNHEGAPIYTIDGVRAAFATVAQQINTTHQGFVMLDGVLSDESDGNISGTESNDWKNLDEFKILSTNAVVTRLWKEHYASILKINKLMADITTIDPTASDVRSQLYAFRALAYLDLFKYFGDLFLVQGSYIPTDVARKSTAAVKDFISADLTNAASNLPVTAPAAYPWYATQASVQMTMARLYLEVSMSDIDNITDTNLASYASLKLADFSTIFESSANTEIIWTISSNLTSPFKEYFVKSGQTVNFFPVIRMTELYLMRALALRSDVSGATSDLKKVADRSGKTLGAINSSVDVLREVEKLYTEEFYREGFRYRFLHLTGQAGMVLTGKGYESYHEHMPVPNEILMKYYNAYQNIGYNN